MLHEWINAKQMGSRKSNTSTSRPFSNSLPSSALNLQASLLPPLNCEMSVTLTQILRIDWQSSSFHLSSEKSCLQLNFGDCCLTVCLLPSILSKWHPHIFAKILSFLFSLSVSNCFGMFFSWFSHGIWIQNIFVVSLSHIFNVEMKEPDKNKP